MHDSGNVVAGGMGRAATRLQVDLIVSCVRFCLSCTVTAIGEDVVENIVFMMACKCSPRVIEIRCASATETLRKPRQHKYFMDLNRINAQ